ncbi:ABC transporter ATP-binding protein [Sporomusa sp. KB1]|jgi:simple sugar transport system ATP-binding protein|uniref:ABC transporter ATP-binding protein n=1 Tax=Sporomusa sp. KB1 TaxID=943346 RepID=UPI0011A1B4EB|nr:ABC transporter ATP-binding protein [Sporomusa sp. KB1]TWH52060.1 nucleoside ABC transporter ATP-binding protein [Sporomusa sp. KB1]
MDTQNILEMRNITKKFANVKACNGVTFFVKSGEVHALLGENGAGKTTLMNILYGFYRPEEGEIYLKGQLTDIDSPKDAISLGIGMVHQHFMLVPTLTVAENVILGLTANLKKLDMEKAVEKVQQLSDQFNFQVDAKALVKDLSIGAQQKVELLKAIYRGADILILDEPTAVLTPQEVKELFTILRQFVAMGKSVIFISHKLWEVMQISNRVTVLRQGGFVDVVQTAEITKEVLADMMVGRSVVLEYAKTPVASSEALLALHGVCAEGDLPVSCLNEFSLCIKKGEVVGVAGVDGNGQRELAESIMGLRAVTKGQVCLNGKDITDMPIRKRIKLGMAHIPEDRLKQGLVLDFTVAENMALDTYDEPPLTCKGIFQPQKMQDIAQELIKEFDVRPPNYDAIIRNFSGGNQQKVILAREFTRSPQFILAVQPTRGLDIGATEFVHRRLLAEKEKGAAVLMISADLDEVLLVSDRVIVMYEGRIMGQFIPGEVSITDIGLMMGGTPQERLGVCE